MSDKTDIIEAELLPRARTEFSEALANELVLAAGLSPSITYIAAECQVPLRTLRFWLQSGNEGHPRYEAFAAEFAKARSRHENRYLANLEEIASDDNPRTANARLKANIELLKKLFPKQYGDQLYVSTMIEHKADAFDLSALPTSSLREFQRMLKVIRAHNEGADQQEVKRLVDKLHTAQRSDDD